MKLKIKRKWNPLNNSEINKEEFEKPLYWKIPSRIIVCSELFHYANAFEVAEKIWDIAFQCPNHLFIITTKYPEKAQEFLNKYSYKRHFGWGNDLQPPIKCGEVINMEDFWMRQRCDWMAMSTGDGFGCNHPENGDLREVDLEEHKEEECTTIIRGSFEAICHTTGCPIAYVPSLAELKKIDSQEYEDCKLNFDNEQLKNEEECYPDYYGGDIMILYRRPKGAYVENIIIHSILNVNK